MPIPFSGCWIWLASLGSHGYGNSCFEKKATVAHRLSYTAFKGKIDDGKLIQHSCDNRWCVNPDHLSQGTDASNAQDKAIKGKAARVLCAEDIKAIRSMYLNGEKIRPIARAKSVSQRLIQQILRGNVWKHVA